MKKVKVIILCLIFLLTGCNKNNKVVDPTINLTFIDSYSNELITPNKELCNRNELIYALDYDSIH